MLRQRSRKKPKRTLHKRSRRRKSPRRSKKIVKKSRKKSRRRSRCRSRRRSPMRKRATFAFGCDEDFITYEPLTNPYITIGDEMCVSCKNIIDLRNQDTFLFDKDPMERIFGITDKSKQSLLHEQLKKCNITKEQKKIIPFRHKPIWDGLSVVINPSKKARIFLLHDVTSPPDPIPHICGERIGMSYLNSLFVSKSSVFLYTWDNFKGRHSVRAFLAAHPLNPTDIMLDLICSRHKGDGYKLLHEFIKLCKSKHFKIIKLKSIADSTSQLINTYKKWGFKLNHVDCNNKCDMYMNI